MLFQMSPYYNNEHLNNTYRVDKGDILLNGRSIYEYSEKYYWKLLGVVFQDFGIFAASLKENIIFDNTDSSMLSSIFEATKLMGVLGQLRNREDTKIMKMFDENGIELSGGQKQKIVIARMLYKNAPLLILDEPTVALDPVAERDVLELLENTMKGKTLIVVSHRMLTCLSCERIIVFDNGKIVETGSHEDLFNLQGKYTDIFNNMLHDF